MTIKTIQSDSPWTNVWHQHYATITANFITFGHGCACSWVAPALAKLTSDDTPLPSGQITIEQMSWIGSIHAIGAFFGVFLFGYMTTFIGSKRTMLLMTVPSVTFWLLIYFGNDYSAILIARFIVGMAGGGLQGTIFLYTTDIANDSIRGRLGSFCAFFRNLGFLIGFIMGAYVEYRVVPCISVVFPMIFAIFFTFVPKTPQFHLKRNQQKKAEVALKYYKGYSGKGGLKDKLFEAAFERLKLAVSNPKTEKKVEAKDLCDRKFLKRIGIGIALTTFQQLTAFDIILSYSVMIYERTGSTIDPQISTILLAVMLILGSLLSTYLADILGRRVLNIVSLIGAAIGLLITSLYQYLSESGYDLAMFAWIPIVSISLIIFISSAGIVPLSMVCSVEMFLPKVRAAGVSIIVFVFCIVVFAFTKMFPILLEHIDLHGCFLMCGIGCMLGTVFMYFVLEETSGQSMEALHPDEENTVPKDDIFKISI